MENMENKVEYTDTVGEWLSGAGPEGDIVMSSRIRLARNLSGSPFTGRTTPEEQARVEKLVLEAMDKAKIAKDIRYVEFEEMPSVDKLYLVERHLTSKEHAGGSGKRGIAYTPDERLSIIVNEEDHLRIQVIKSGLGLEEAWKEMNEIDDSLSGELDFAFSSQYGYLTACPTNTGTGIRVSIMLHLPALAITRQIEKVFHAMNKINLAVRGYYGERTEALGDFYQISNQVTLGKSEEAIVENLHGVVPQIISYEQKIRETLLVENRHNLEDRIWRAFGTLVYARSISSEETMNLLSAVRMGINLGIIDDLPLDKVNSLFLLAQPAHLQKKEGRTLGPGERDTIRAEMIRTVLDGKKKTSRGKNAKKKKSRNDTEKKKKNEDKTEPGKN